MELRGLVRRWPNRIVVDKRRNSAETSAFGSMVKPLRKWKRAHLCQITWQSTSLALTTAPPRLQGKNRGNSTTQITGEMDPLYLLFGSPHDCVLSVGILPFPSLAVWGHTFSALCRSIHEAFTLLCLVVICERWAASILSLLVVLMPASATASVAGFLRRGAYSAASYFRRCRVGWC